MNINDIAEKYCMNTYILVAESNNEKIYSLGRVDNNGVPIPTGLPILIRLYADRYEAIEGRKALELMDSLGFK